MPPPHVTVQVPQLPQEAQLPSTVTCLKNKMHILPSRFIHCCITQLQRECFYLIYIYISKEYFILYNSIEFMQLLTYIYSSELNHDDTTGNEGNTIIVMKKITCFNILTIKTYLDSDVCCRWLKKMKIQHNHFLSIEERG